MMNDVQKTDFRYYNY